MQRLAVLPYLVNLHFYKREYKALCEISKTSNQKWGYLMYHIYSSLLCDIKCIP